MATSYSYSQSALDNLEQSQSNLESSLQDSPGSYSDSLNVNPKDASTEAKLRSVQSALDKLQAKQINEKWYGKQKAGETNTEGAGKDDSLIFKGLDALAKPLYAVAGAAKYVTGDRSGGFFNTVNQNINTDKSTFGDILAKHGAPKVVSAPLGFALDVAFDPVNWLTVGTGALIPKLGYGLVKGAAEGAGIEAVGAALKEKGLRVAAQTGKFIPGLSGSEVLSNIGTKALEAGEKFNTLTKRNLLDTLATRAAKPSIGDYASTVLHSLPGGDWVAKNFSYSPEEWMRVAKIKDEVMTAAQGKGGVLAPVLNKELGLIEPPNYNVIRGTLENLPVGEAGALTDTPIKKIGEIVNNSNNVYNVKSADSLFNQEKGIMQDGIDLSDKFSHLARSQDSVEQMTRLLGEANIEAKHRDVVKALNQLSGTGDTPNAFDKLMTGVRGMKVGNQEIGKKLIDGYANFIGAFKSAKIGFLSPASVTNAVVGNTVMLHMMGDDITDPETLKFVKKAWEFVRGKNSSEFLDSSLLAGEEWQDFMRKYPGIFKKTYGFGGEKVLGAKNMIDELISSAPKLAGGDKYQADEIKKIIADTFKNKQSELSMGNPLKYSSGVKESERATDIASQELTGEAFNRFKEDLADIASGRPSQSQLDRLKSKNLSGIELEKAYNKLAPSELKQKAAQKLHWALTAPSESYSSIDQAYKLGTATKYVERGVTEDTLMKMTKSVIPGTRGPISIEPKDILDKYVKDGKYYYRLTPDKATDIVNKMFMNYAAMPAAIKVLRSVPVLGSPFFSFQYAMASKLGQTLYSNPAALNKVTLGLHEFSGTKTPLEKEAINTPYYNFYNSPGMMKLPFFKENPLYLNVANMIPYYSMNMFMPSERKYADTLGGKVVAALDKTPILKDPVGQTIFDYFVQPLIIRDSIPQGSFGQPLYPEGSGALAKTGYAVRNLAEAPLPTAVAALAPVTPESALDYIPSYRWRQLGYALRGKSQLGAKGQESKTGRTLRALGSSVGISTQPLDLTYAASNLNKK